MTQQHRTNFTGWWLGIFYVLAGYKFWQGMWLFQCDPFLFQTRFDGVSWLFMLTGIHLRVMASASLQYLLDGLFYLAPLVYGLVYVNKPDWAARFAWLWLIINWVYVQVYTLFPINSIEAHIGWLLFPLLFTTRSLPSFYLIMHGLRYFFLYFFFSAGVWKLIQGGAFEPSQMSGILMDQHAEYLVSSASHWQARFLYRLIEMPVASFSVYWLGILLELSFIIGFFTRRFDRLLVAGFILFLVFDYLVMRIPYFEVSPFLLTLFFSHFKAPTAKA